MVDVVESKAVDIHIEEERARLPVHERLVRLHEAPTRVDAVAVGGDRFAGSVFQREGVIAEPPFRVRERAVEQACEFLGAEGLEDQHSAA